VDHVEELFLQRREKSREAGGRNEWSALAAEVIAAKDEVDPPAASIATA
jgi:hypothetical protein